MAKRSQRSQKDVRKLKLNRSEITADETTQVRASLSKQTIEEYKEAMLDGQTFPRVEVFFDGDVYWLADGFHRFAAYKKAGFKRIPSNVHTGDKEDALIFAASANQKHGLRYKQADKRRAVDMILQVEATKKRQWSDREIARLCAVDHKFVGARRKKMQEAIESGDVELAADTASEQKGFGEKRTFIRKGQVYEQKLGKKAQSAGKQKSEKPSIEKAPDPETQVSLDETPVYDPDGRIAKLISTAKQIELGEIDPEDALGPFSAELLTGLFGGTLKDPKTEKTVFGHEMPSKPRTSLEKGEHYVAQTWAGLERVWRTLYAYISQHDPDEALNSIPLNYRYDAWQVLLGLLDWHIKAVEHWQEHFEDPAHLEQVQYMPGIDPFGLKRLRMLKDRLEAFDRDQPDSQKDETEILHETVLDYTDRIRNDQVEASDRDVANKLLESIDAMQEAAPESQKSYVSIQGAQVALRELYEQLDAEGEDTQEVTVMMESLHKMRRRLMSATHVPRSKKIKHKV